MRVVVAVLVLALSGCALYRSPIVERANFADRMAEMKPAELDDYKLRDVADAYSWANRNPDVDAAGLQKYLKEKAATVRESDWSAIEAGNVRTGMSKTAVIMAWGQPTKINTSCFQDGCDEQWVYRLIGTRYVYFQGDAVTSYSY